MSNPFTPPTKEHIKEKYGIADDDFEILVSDAVPTAEELEKEGIFLESVAEYFGVPTFLKKRRLWILAIIFAPYWEPKAKQGFSECIVTTSTFYQQTLIRYAHEHQEPTRYALAIPDPVDIPRPFIDLRTGSFPVGTTIYPYSGKNDLGSLLVTSESLLDCCFVPFSYNAYFAGI